MRVHKQCKRVSPLSVFRLAARLFPLLLASLLLVRRSARTGGAAGGVGAAGGAG